jgi:hypothetical protein
MRYSAQMIKPAYIAFALALVLLGCAHAPEPAEPLVWDALTKDCTAKSGEVVAHIFFTAKNVSSKEVIINKVETSCGCTVAKLPGEPWRLKPKENGKLELIVDLRGKTGTLTKGIRVVSTNAEKSLLINVTIPPGSTNNMPADADRIWNQAVAGTDHQAVFKNDCVKCHLEPAFGKYGENLYRVSCGICHESPHRATMVPNLHALNKETSADYWRNWVAHGKAGTLMPGFAATDGGPLDDSQIDSLVEYLQKNFSKSGKVSASNSSNQPAPAVNAGGQR